MDKSYIFMIVALLAGVSFLLIVPKERYKKTLLYAILFGGIGDGLTVGLLSLLGLIRYKNTGAFDVLGIFSIWTPITWTYTFAIFFYLLPVRKLFVIPYLVGFAGLTYAMGLTFENFGLFEYIGFHRYTAPLVFMLWYGVSAWAYYRLERIPLVGYTARQEP